MFSSQLTHLTFNYYFNQKVNLPNQIIYLNLDCSNSNIVDNLPFGIKELELTNNFNLELNNLPNSIEKITFNKYNQYDKELNCLPNFVNTIQLPRHYDKKIKKIPKDLQKIICAYNYKYIEDFKHFIVETYNPPDL
jgi:hypothetical protein